VSRPEWIELHEAAWRLATHLNVDLTIADDIVREAMKSGEVPVRGMPLGSVSIVPRIISKEEIGSIFRLPFVRSISLFPQFQNTEIKWDRLLAYAPNLLPSSLGRVPDPTVAPELRTAPPSKIDEALTAVYDEAEIAGEKPPNLNQVIAPTQEHLRKQGLEASGRRIQGRAEADEFRKRRRKAGATIASERRHQRKK
jgi:hypothetical protein